MNYTLRYTPEARDELQEGYDYYSSKSERVGDDFLDKIEATIAHIERSPTLSPIVAHDIRKAVVQKFPYIILYHIVNERIIILSIFHTKQDPQKWMKRLL